MSALLQENPRASFSQWAAHHGKSYLTINTESEQRFLYWQQNVAEHIGKLHTSTVVLNGLMDLHDDEIKQSHLGHSPRHNNDEPE